MIRAWFFEQKLMVIKKNILQNDLNQRETK
jgi:hypothetical protein